MSEAGGPRQAIFIITDTMGTGLLGCYGSDMALTPADRGWAPAFQLGACAEDMIKRLRNIAHPDSVRMGEPRRKLWRDHASPAGHEKSHPLPPRRRFTVFYQSV